MLNATTVSNTLHTHPNILHPLVGDLGPVLISTMADGFRATVLKAMTSSRHQPLLPCSHIISQQSEAALPGFDLTRKVGRKIKLQKYRRAVVLCVVDMADFDGSLPRAALQELLPGLEQGQERSQAALGYRLVIAASKVDLLPAQATAARLQVCRQQTVASLLLGLTFHLQQQALAFCGIPGSNCAQATSVLSQHKPHTWSA